MEIVPKTELEAFEEDLIVAEEVSIQLLHQLDELEKKQQVKKEKLREEKRRYIEER